MPEAGRKKRLRRHTWRIIGYGLLLSLALHIIFLGLALLISFWFSGKPQPVGQAVETIEIDLQHIDPEELKSILENRFPTPPAADAQEKIVLP